MAHGKRASILKNAGGKDYFKKIGFLKKCWGWMKPVSTKAGSNKKTKKYTHKSERMQIKTYLRNNDEY